MCNWFAVNYLTINLSTYLSNFLHVAHSCAFIWPHSSSSNQWTSRLLWRQWQSSHKLWWLIVDVIRWVWWLSWYKMPSTDALPIFGSPVFARYGKNPQCASMPFNWDSKESNSRAFCLWITPRCAADHTTTFWHFWKLALQNIWPGDMQYSCTGINPSTDWLQWLWL